MPSGQDWVFRRFDDDHALSHRIAQRRALHGAGFAVCGAHGRHGPDSQDRSATGCAHHHPVAGRDAGRRHAGPLARPAIHAAVPCCRRRRPTPAVGRARRPWRIHDAVCRLSARLCAGSLHSGRSDGRTSPKLAPPHGHQRIHCFTAGRPGVPACLWCAGPDAAGQYEPGPGLQGDAGLCARRLHQVHPLRHHRPHCCTRHDWRFGGRQ